MKTDIKNQITLEELNAPSVQYMMINTDHTLIQFSKGYANLEMEVPADPETAYKIYSATKTFTAIAILQLQEEGKLQITEKVTKYLPEYPELKEVSIKSLLAHQSGISNPLPLKWVHLQQEENTFKEEAFIDTRIRQNPPKTKPGKKFAYSNINYLILDRIIQKVSGMKFKEYIEQKLIQRVPGNSYMGFKIPDSSSATGYQKKGFYSFLLGFLLDKKKYTYHATEDYLGFHPMYVNGKAYGGMISTADRLSSYLWTLLKEDSPLLTKESKLLLFEEQLTTDGKMTGMALGWYTGNLKGNRYVCHAGGGGGFYCEIRIYPDLKLASMLLLNRSGFSDERLLDKIDINYIQNK